MSKRRDESKASIGWKLGFKTACDLATRRGLYLLQEGSRDHPSWMVFSTSTGKCLGWYDPVNNMAYAQDNNRRIESYSQALEFISAHELVLS